MTARHRIEELGAAALSDAELVALLIGGDVERAGVVALQLLDGGLPRLARLRPGAGDRDGLTTAQRDRLCAAFELGRRAVRASQDRQRHLHAGTICQVLAPRIAHLEWEEFWVVLLTSRLEEMRCVRVSMGGIAQCSILPREAFAPAVIHAAPCVVFAHNHPSGDSEPSTHDHEAQVMLDEAGRALGIHVIDHLVISDRGHHSVRDGYLTFDGKLIPDPPDEPSLDLVSPAIVFEEVRQECPRQS